MKSLFAFAFLFTCLFAAAQYPSISFNNIGLNQGLSQSSVVSISFDEKGFVWMATQDGLNRYDGKDFLVVDRKFDDITSGSYSRLGKVIRGDSACLWIISKGGQLEKLDLINNSLQPVDLSAGKSRFIITCILPEKNNRLWIGTESGDLILYDSKSNKINWQIKVPGKDNQTAVNALFKDSQQQLWVVGSRVGFLKNNRLILDTEIEGPELKPGMQLSSIAEDKNGNLWLGSLGEGLFMKKKNENFRRFTAQGFSLPANLVIEDLLIDEEGRIWIGTYGKGLFIIDEKEKKLQQFVNDKKKPFSVAFNDVLTIEQDENKGIWIGTDGGGVSYYSKRRNSFLLFNDQTVPEHIEIAMVRSIATDKNGIIWAGTSNKGLTRIDYKNGQYKTWHFPSYKKDIYNPDRIVSLFVDGKEIVWLGTQGNGLILFDSKKEKTIKWFHPEAASPLKIPDGTAWCIYPTSEEEIWIGTESSGLCLFNKQKGFIDSYISSNETNGVNDAIKSITQIDDSILCIGFGKSGLQLFNTNSKKFQALKSKELDTFFAAETPVKTLYYKKPFLWIGTDGRGLAVINLLNGKCSFITDKDGLPNNTIYGILPDKEGYLWVSTNKGLSRFSTDIVNKNPHPREFTNYNSAQGLQSNEFNTGAYCKALNGTLLFGGISGLNLFDPLQLNQPEKMVPVVFTGILVDNEPVKEDSSAVYKKHVELSYRDHSIAFTFAALNFSSGQQYHYYYKLEGYDKEWIDADQRNYVSYTNIPSGEYNFKVKYVQQGKSHEGPGAEMHILINAPFWKSWWFITALVLVALSLIYALYRYRISQVLKLFKIRQGIATDLHDDIGSTLTNINILSELSKKNLENPVQANSFLNRISEEVQASSQSLDDIIWSINTHNDTWQETFSRMRRYAAEVFENSSTAYYIKLDEQAGTTKLNMEKRRDIFLIYKELLNNIHKHAAATEVTIDMWFQEQKLIMAIGDNGKGFNKNVQTHRNGLKNLSTRVARWKGSMNISSGEVGTTVKIVL